MQHAPPGNPNRPAARAWRPALGLLLVGLAAAGCGGPPPPQQAAKRPHADVRLTVRCPDPGLAAVLAPLARAWADRTGATVEVSAAPMAPGGAADIGIIPAAELGAWADRGDLAAVPATLRAGDNPYQWLGVLAVYRDRLAAWGGQLRALPLVGDGYVVLYRADRLADPPAAAAFAARYGRPPAAPATWEDFAELATFFRDRDQKPSLPPLPDDARLADLFFRVAACYDRPALSEAAAGKAGAASLSFLHDMQTGRPRLESSGFVTAAQWLGGLRGCWANGLGDATAAVADGRAVLAVVSLAELARLPREKGAVPERFGIAPLPGARVVDPKTSRPVPGMAPNYVPYLAGGRLGVVRTSCQHPAAAFELLAELAGPVRGAELIVATGLGAGPTRTAQLDRDKLLVWLGYGFDPERSRQLQDAMRDYVRPTVGNPAFGLRGPDQASLTAVLGGELRQVAGGADAVEGLKRATAAWVKLDDGVPADRRLRWRRQAAGLNE